MLSPIIKSFAIGCLLCALAHKVAMAAPGDLDTSFGQNGIGAAGITSDPLTGKRIAVQSDGKIVVAGIAGTAGDPDSQEGLARIVVARLNLDGSIDTSFGGSNGVATVEFDQITGPVNVAIQSDGKVVVAGRTNPIADPPFFLVQPKVPLSFAVARFTAGGALDPNFGTGGKVKIPLLFNDESSVGGMAIQNGGVLLAGSINRFSSPCSGLVPCRVFLLTKLDGSGSADTLFGGSLNLTGSVTNDFGLNPTLGHFSKANAVTLQADGKIVVAGCTHAFSNNGGAFALTRYSADGLIDSAFGSSGRVITPFSANGTNCKPNAESLPATTTALAVTVQADGKIVAAGSTSTASSCPNLGECISPMPAIARYNSNGILDVTFGGSGKVKIPSLSNDAAASAVMQPDGKILIATAFGKIVRLTANGGLDNTFGVNGVISSLGSAVAIQKKSLSSGAIVVPGTIQVSGTGIGHSGPVFCLFECLSVRRFDAFTTRFSKVGTFALAPANSTQLVIKPFLYSFAWTVPDPGTWHDLKTLELRIRDVHTKIIEVIFDVEKEAFRLADQGNDRLKRGVSPGAAKILSSGQAALHLAHTAVVTESRTAPTITLNLSLEMKLPTAGRRLSVYVAATDIAGNSSGFVKAGTLTVSHLKRNRN